LGAKEYFFVTGTKIASTKMDAKIEAKGILKVYIMQTLLSIYKSGR